MTNRAVVICVDERDAEELAALLAMCAHLEDDAGLESLPLRMRRRILKALAEARQSDRRRRIV